MTRLPTLGGANGYAIMINSRGDVAGLAENNTQDPGCPVHQFEPVVWENGMIRQLPTYTGDSYGVAAQINDKGADCRRVGELRTLQPEYRAASRGKSRLLWEKDGRSMISATSAGLEGSRGTTLVRS